MADAPEYKERYGILWPLRATELDIELQCWRNYDELKTFPYKTLLERWMHFKNAWAIISPPKMKNGKNGYIFSTWTDRRIKSWCDRNFMTWWGPSSSGKTTDAAHIAYITWLAAPDETTVQVCSTTIEMLKKRIMREVIKIHTRLGNRTIGMYVPSKLHVVLRDEIDEENPINGIFGVPVGQGSKGIKGVHNTYNYMIIDEMQDTHPNAAEEWDNLSTGTDYKFLGMGNPVAWTDPLGVYSRPTKKNMRDLHPDTDKEWQTAKGVCLFFDGRESPGVADPKTFPMLLTQKQIDEMATFPGVNSPRFWTQRIGFIPREGLQETVLTESMIVINHGVERAVWKRAYITVAGLDPAFSNGGDKKVLRFARVGLSVDGTYLIDLYRKVYLNIEMKLDADGHELPVSYDFADKVNAELKAEGVPLRLFGMDVTGAQRTLADIIDERGGGKCHRVDFSGAPSDQPIKDGEREILPRMIYKNRVTELWFTVARYVRAKQMRGMDDEELWQFSSRRIIPARDGSSRLLVESKRDMKAMSGRSPDDADACACVADVCRVVLIMDFGGSPKINAEPRNHDHDVDSSEQNYLTEPTECE